MIDVEAEEVATEATEVASKSVSDKRNFSTFDFFFLIFICKTLIIFFLLVFKIK